MNKICNPYHTFQYCVSTLSNFPTAHPAGAFPRARFLVSVAAFHPFSSRAIRLANVSFLPALHLLQTFQSQFGCNSSESVTSGARTPLTLVSCYTFHFHYTWSIRHTSSCSCACNTRHGSKLPHLFGPVPSDPLTNLIHSSPSNCYFNAPSKRDPSPWSLGVWDIPGGSSLGLTT
jgi:hypothetical protein